MESTILGQDIQCLEVTLAPGEAIVAEVGALTYMEEGITLQTTLGDGSPASSGVIGKLLGAGARLLTGEKIFVTRLTNGATVKRSLALAAPHPGSIARLDLRALGGSVLVQRYAFLAATHGTSVGVGFHRKIGTLFFGGEGLVMQKITGQGLAFVHAGGTLIEKDLLPGQTVFVDSGCVVALQAGVSFDVKAITNVMSLFFGGEGLFLAELKGPGKVWIQSQPYGRTLAMILAAVMKRLPRNAK